jgi:hypothetical protein
MGRTVREWNNDELGGVFVGTHHTDITWDGTNNSGSQVASGLYFYTIEAVTADGEKYKLDRFKGDVGKLMLLR